MIPSLSPLWAARKMLSFGRFFMHLFLQQELTAHIARAMMDGIYRLHILSDREVL